MVLAWHAGAISIDAARVALGCRPAAMLLRAHALGALGPRQRKRWTTKAKFTREQLVAEVAAGTHARAIVEKYGIANVPTLKVIASRHGVSLAGLLRQPGMHGNKRAWSPQDDLIVAAWKRGELSTLQVKQRLRTCYGTLHKRAKELGLRREKKCCENTAPAVTELPPAQLADATGSSPTPPVAPALLQDIFDRADGRVTVNALGPDPYLAALRREHVLPRDEVYPGSVRQPRKREWPQELRAAVKTERPKPHLRAVA